MTVENIKSTLVTAFEAGGTRPNGFSYGVGGWFTDSYTVTGTSTTSGSTYKSHVLPSSTIPEIISLYSDGTTDTADVDVGLYHSQTATAYDGVLATALDIDDTGAHDALNISLGGVYSANTGPKALWELAGLSVDPGGDFYIFAALDADTVAAGEVEVRVKTLRIA